MATLHSLLSACHAEQQALAQPVQQQIALWEKWLVPIAADSAVGDDPGYDDDFQQMREEVNKLSGADTGLVCALAEKLLTGACKDVRVATYYIWARLHIDGESGLA
ncbi:type VI secretion system ImpA family N-terminal domain-containing protein, partial [Yersinia kristensenii]